MLERRNRRIVVRRLANPFGSPPAIESKHGDFATTVLPRTRFRTCTTTSQSQFSNYVQDISMPCLVALIFGGLWFVRIRIAEKPPPSTQITPPPTSSPSLRVGS